MSGRFSSNNCRDDTAGVLKAGAAQQPHLAITVIDIDFPPNSAHVGSAQRIAMEEAMRTVGPDSMLLTTDADAVPAPNWINSNLAAIANGADLVGGHILATITKRRCSVPDFCGDQRVISTMHGSSINCRRSLIRCPTIRGRVTPIIPVLVLRFEEKSTKP